MISTDKITEIFCLIDDFCIELDQVLDRNGIDDGSGIKRRNRAPKMSQSEVITIMVLFHQKGYRCLQHFYLDHVCKHMREDFPDTVSYNRFVELQQKAVVPMVLFLQMCCLGQCSGISFMDSTLIKVCHSKREKQNRVFKGIAEKGRAAWGGSLDSSSISLSTKGGRSLIFSLPRAMWTTASPSRTRLSTTRCSGRYSPIGGISERICSKNYLWTGSIW